MFVLARERAFELRINASHRLGGLKGLRESLWTEPKIILRVHAAEWTGIRCLRLPWEWSYPAVRFCSSLSFFFFFFPSPLEPSVAQLAAAVKIYVDVLPSVISLFFSLLLSFIIFYTFPPPFVLSPHEEFANGDFKKGGREGENVCQHFAARRATNWRVTGNEVSKGLNTLSLGRARVAERQI